MSDLFNLIGIPFVDKGRSLNGCDCMGLAVLTHEVYGEKIPDFLIDSDSESEINKKFIDQLYSNKWKKLDYPVPPCIVTFGFNKDDKDMVTHVGTYIGDGKILHIINDKKGTSHIIKMDHPFFKNKILGFYKYVEN